MRTVEVMVHDRQWRGHLMEILDRSADEISVFLESLDHVGVRQQDGPDKASTRNRLGERQPETVGQGN